MTCGGKRILCQYLLLQLILNSIFIRFSGMFFHQYNKLYPIYIYPILFYCFNSFIKLKVKYRSSAGKQRSVFGLKTARTLDLTKQTTRLWFLKSPMKDITIISLHGFFQSLLKNISPKNNGEYRTNMSRRIL